MPFPDYQISTEVGGSLVKIESLESEVVAAGPYTTTFEGVSLAGDIAKLHFDAEPSAANKTVLDGVMSDHDHDLALAKTSKSSAIDKRTSELIGLGFEYPVASGNMFSLTERAQLNLAATKTERDNAVLVYDVIWPGLDDTHQLTIDDDAEFDLFYTEAYDARKAHLDSGNALKASVIAAVDIAAVDAVVDSR